jgi:hypothetical protein
MTDHAPAIQPLRAVRTAAIACVVLALLAMVVAIAAFRAPLAGGAIASGILLGTLNGAAAAQLIKLPVPFMATSLVRLLTLSMVGIAIGLAFGISRVWLVILGLGIAQLALAGAALRASVRQP